MVLPLRSTDRSVEQNDPSEEGRTYSSEETHGGLVRSFAITQSIINDLTKI